MRVTVEMDLQSRLHGGHKLCGQRFTFNIRASWRSTFLRPRARLLVNSEPPAVAVKVHVTFFCYIAWSIDTWNAVTSFIPAEPRKWRLSRCLRPCDRQAVSQPPSSPRIPTLSTSEPPAWRSTICLRGLRFLEASEPPTWRSTSWVPAIGFCRTSEPPTWRSTPLIMGY